jgi:hypothetical protein
VNGNTLSYLGSTTAATFNTASIGYNTVLNNIGTYTAANTMGIALSGFGANVVYANGAATVAGNYGVYGSLSFTVATSNSYVVLSVASGGNHMNSFSTTASGSSVAVNTVSNSVAQAAMMIIPACTAGTYTTTSSAASNAALELVSYVFPPYTVTLYDSLGGSLLNTGTITIGINAYTSGTAVNVIGINAITATPPAGHSFTSWSTSGSNIIVQNTASATTNMIVEGWGTLTATYT